MAVWQGVPQCSHLQVSVNVSARQFRHPDFVRQVADVLQETGAKAHLLTLELTGYLVLDNVDDAIGKMRLLRTEGVRFSVDDFGTGYSSLAYLTRLPLHQLKIDQSFVRDLGIRDTDDVVVQTIIGMGRSLDLEVIAEGVGDPGAEGLPRPAGLRCLPGLSAGQARVSGCFRCLDESPRLSASARRGFGGLRYGPSAA